jgi:hypothetical protein
MVFCSKCGEIKLYSEDDNRCKYHPAPFQSVKRTKEGWLYVHKYCNISSDWSKKLTSFELQKNIVCRNCNKNLNEDIEVACCETFGHDFEFTPPVNFEYSDSPFFVSAEDDAKEDYAFFTGQDDWIEQMRIERERIVAEKLQEEKARYNAEKEDWEENERILNKKIQEELPIKTDLEQMNQVSWRKAMLQLLKTTSAAFKNGGESEAYDSIENYFRTIIKERELTNPEQYNMMLSMLNDLIQKRKNRAIATEEWVKQMNKIVQKVFIIPF